MDETIRARLDDTRKQLFEHFDEEVHQRLKLQLEDTKAQLDRFSKRFWSITRFILGKRANFDETALAFDLEQPPREDISRGRYHLISKSTPRANEAEGEERDSFLYRLSHPLGELVIDYAKRADTPPAHVVFDVTHRPGRIHVIEALRGQSGYLTLTRLAIDSFEREEHLLFSGFSSDGRPLDPETIEKLFECSAQVQASDTLSDEVSNRLGLDVERHSKATISRSLEQNSKYFNDAREKLEKWADDLVLASEKALTDTKEQIKVLRRQARQSVTLDEQHDIQQKIQKLERTQRRQRQDIFKAEDEIIEKRDRLVESLERRLAQKSSGECLFTIAWSVV